MTSVLLSRKEQLLSTYRSTLLDNVIPFWMWHGRDLKHGGLYTALHQDGSLIDTDKSVWFQGRGAWMFATLYNTVERNPEWLEVARSSLEFIRNHCLSPSGKLYFTVTQEGKPLRMRRYVYSEAFAAIASAAYSRATDDLETARDSVRFFQNYLHYSFRSDLLPSKVDSQTRPSQGIGPWMICINTAQEVRANLGDVEVLGQSCTEWIDEAIQRIEENFYKPEYQVLLETAGPNGEVLDHFEGRQLNPGHALECAWFILHEAKLRNNLHYQTLGLSIIDWMWKRGWDHELGGFFYFRDLRDLPVQEYWHDMKFWWPHCEAIIATLLAHQLTGQEKYAQWHQMVHDWSFQHFPDAEHGEWFGYLHRNGRISERLKGNMWKGPFHLPRMLWYCATLLQTSDSSVSQMP